MKWILLFVNSWNCNIILVDLRQLKTNIWTGLFAICLHCRRYPSHKPWVIRRINGIKVFSSSLFFIAGPFFTVGCLLAQYHPRRNAPIFIYVLVITALFSAQGNLLLRMEL